MESIIQVKQSPSGVFWTSFVQAFCETCGTLLRFQYHGNERAVWDGGERTRVIQCYYACPNPKCANKDTVVARHPEIIPKKYHSRSTFTRVVYLKYYRRFSVKQILQEMPHLSQWMVYEIIRTFRAANRVEADTRLARKLPPGTRIAVSIDGMEPEKGQPALYTVREVTTGELLAAAFLEVASAEALHDLLAGVEAKYGVEFSGFVSDKGRNIVAVRDKYYPGVPHQYCVVHFLKNATKALRDADKSLQKELRSETRNLAVFKTITTKSRAAGPDLTEKERAALADIKAAILAVANRKKREMFDLAGKTIYEDLARAHASLVVLGARPGTAGATSKFKALLGHVVAKLGNLVANFYPRYQLVALGNYFLHPIFHAVVDPSPKHPRRVFDKVVRSWETLADRDDVPLDVRGLVQQALKVARSYARGLFAWRRARTPRTNNGTEQFYNEKKGDYRRNSPRKVIGVTLGLTGVEEMFVPRDLTVEVIEAAWDHVGGEAYREVRREMAARAARRAFEKACRRDIKTVLRSIFDVLGESDEP